MTLAAAGQGNSTLQISAGPAKTSALGPLTMPLGGDGRFLGAIALCGGLLPLGWRRRRVRRLAVLATLLVAGLGLQGCGFSGVPLITPGSYMVTVTATDTVTQRTRNALLRIVIVTQATQLPPAPNQ